jgi:hypothetical protein
MSTGLRGAAVLLSIGAALFSGTSVAQDLSWWRYTDPNVSVSVDLPADLFWTSGRQKRSKGGLSQLQTGERM